MEAKPVRSDPVRSHQISGVCSGCVYGSVTMSIKETLTIVGFSVLATVLSTVIALAVGAAFPFRIGPDLAQPTAPGTVLTEENMKAAQQAAQARMERQQDRLREDPLHVLPDIRRAALPVSWLPWLAIPYFVGWRRPTTWATALVVPAVLSLTPFLLLSELLTYSIAMLLGALILSRSKGKTKN
jgi:hypothetical protein